MNDIDARTGLIRKEKRTGLMTHLVAGYPSLRKTVSIASAMEKAGADFIELQVPFSDPIADGPTIMGACDKALARGVRTRDIMRTTRAITRAASAPVLLMAYYNNVFRYGVEDFCIEARDAGVSGLIVPDMPIDEEPMEHFIGNAERQGLYAIRLLSPASTPKRIMKNAGVARGFVYCTTHQGITGAKDSIDVGTISYLKKVKKSLGLPIAVGFGISKAEHVRAIAPYADIAVVGSAIINVIDKDPGNAERNVGTFIGSIMHKIPSCSITRTYQKRTC